MRFATGRAFSRPVIKAELVLRPIFDLRNIIYQLKESEMDGSGCLVEMEIRTFLKQDGIALQAKEQKLSILNKKHEIKESRIS